MGWGIKAKQNDEVEFELPDEVKTKIEAGEKAAQSVEELRQTLASKDTELAAFKSEFEAFRASVAQATQPKVETPAADEEPDFFADPASAVSRAIGKNLGPVVGVIAEMKADKVMEDLRRKYPELSAQAIDTEFKNATAKYGIADRANSTLMENTFRIVRDRMRESGKLESEEYSNIMERSRQVSNLTSGSHDTKPVRKFAPAEESFLRRYGITNEEAATILAEVK